MPDMLLGPPPAEAAAGVVFLHGRGQSPALLRQPIRRLALPGVHVHAPEAEGNTWYPHRFIAPLADNDPALPQAVARVAGIVARLRAAGLPDSRIVIAGFSQGACLAAEFLLRHPARFGGAVIWTGGLAGPPGTAWPAAPALAGLPMLLTTGEDDAFVPAWRVRETAAHFAALGVALDVRIWPAKPHEIGEEEMAAAERLVGLAADRPA